MARNIEEAEHTALHLHIPLLQPVPRHGALLLSYSQQRLWFLEQMGFIGPAYTLVDAMRLRGPLQIVALTQTLQEIVRRHAILRTTFLDVEGQPHQIIGP